MPGHGKQEADNRYSEAYQVLLLERETLLKQRSKLLGKKKLNQLNEKHQLQYCGLNKKLMENYWQGYKTAKADEDFESSAKDFHNARKMGFSKAKDLFLEIKPNTPLKKKASFSSSSEHNFIKGLRLHLGLGYPQNQKEAARFYKKAAKQEHVSAQYNLGFCYSEAIGIAKDEKEAVKWFRLAAEQGDADAQYNLGVCYDKGIGIAKDEKEAVKWYRLAAEQGDADAQYNLGVCYDKGTGIAKDEKEAVKWYRLAAEQGDADAQHNLGACYDESTGIAKDEKEAVKWFRLAAEQGDAHTLGILKKLNTPLADYTVALLEKHPDKLIELALSDKELSDDFFEKDIFYVIKQLGNQDDSSIFLQTIAERIKELDKNQNALSTALLLSVEKAIRTKLIESNEENAALMTGLLENFEPGDTEKGHIKNLMHFFCNIDDEENAKEALELLCKLWYRARSLIDFQMDDSGLNRLIATRIVSQLFDNRYVLNFTKEFSADELETLFYAHSRKSPLTVEHINNILSQSLLIESKYLPKNVLSALKAYLSNDDNFNGGRPCYIEKLNGALQRANPGNEQAWQSLFDDLKEYAFGVLVKQKRDTIFKSNKTLCDEEKTLLQVLSRSDTLGVSEWIEEHIASHQESASPSASLG